MNASREVKLSPEVRQVFVRTFLLPLLVLLAATGLAFFVGAEVSGWLRYAPFALSLILFGLPHGAVDHLVPGRLYKGESSLTSIVWVVVFYFIFATLYLLVWFASPGFAFVFFIALTWFHWGQGDLYFLAALGREMSSVPLSDKILTVLVRGGMPMLVPLLAFPDVYRSVAYDIVGLFRGDAVRFEWIFGPTFRTVAGVLFVLAVVLVLLQVYRLTRLGTGSIWRIELVELGILAVYFTVVPPILALGIYFCLWHSPRHVARLMMLNRAAAAALANKRTVKALRYFVRDAAPLTVVALALLVSLYFLVPGPVDGPGGLLGVYLVLISTLTLPHVAIVCLMDLRQGIWR